MATSTKITWRITEEKWNYKTRVTQTVKEQSQVMCIYSRPFGCDTTRILSRIYRLGEKSRFLGVWRHAPWKFLEANMHSDAIWCIFETQYWEMLPCVHWPRRGSIIFGYSYLYTVIMIIFFSLGGGKLLPRKYPRQNPDYLFPRYGIGKSAALKKYASSTLLRGQAT